MDPLLLAATFIDIFASVFNGLIIARIVMGLFASPENRLFGWLVSVTEPILAPIRRVLPASGGIDFSPTVAVILLYVLDMAVSGLIRQS